ncbi:cysteine--tRNA ligase, partial [Propionimicrobium lymphophilum]|uniref:cysteine--tRNA ligase n=1 Tax=Propionimicrobium lymphophilum TaxID=33012 RepID=UPI0023F060AA
LHRAYTALGCRPPDYEPRATGHIPEQIELIQRLLERGHAYVADDGSANVYFDVRSWPQYGELSHQKISEMVNDEGADNKGKRDARDFALWKGHKEDEPETASWPSPWGRGRPGWHLECSAMSLKYLGAEFDIHGGGMDLKFPHHENELAQSRAAGFGFAKYWMHNAFVTAAGEKMSKSLGNYARVTEVTKQYPARAVRLYLAQTHYRSVIEFSDTSLEEATARLSRIDGFLEHAGISGAPQFRFEDLPEEFVKAMDDDLSTPAAVAVIYETVKAGNKALDSGHDASEQLKALRAMLHILGLDPLAPEWENSASGPDHTEIIDGLVKLVLDQRTAARERKDWANADAIRDTLTQLGIKVEDTPAGARWQIGG